MSNIVEANSISGNNCSFQAPIRSPEIFLKMSPVSEDEKSRRNDKLIPKG